MRSKCASVGIETGEWKSTKIDMRSGQWKSTRIDEEGVAEIHKNG
jgi:hypothetical protein